MLDAAQSGTALGSRAGVAGIPPPSPASLHPAWQPVPPRLPPVRALLPMPRSIQAGGADSQVLGLAECTLPGAVELIHPVLARVLAATFAHPPSPRPSSALPAQGR